MRLLDHCSDDTCIMRRKVLILLMSETIVQFHFFAKLLETIIYDKIIDFVIPQVSSQQFGFLRKRSSVNQLLSFYSEIFSSVDRRIPCDVIFLDFRKAFDSIPHPELLFKLWAHGITGQLVSVLPFKPYSLCLC